MVAATKTTPFEITEDMCAGPYYTKYHTRANEARALRSGSKWEEYWDVKLQPAAKDTYKVGAMFIDAQGTFCYPLGGEQDAGELFVGGRSGRAAIEDSCRSANWILRNVPWLTFLDFTMDTHTMYQVFHESYLICNSAFKCSVTGHQYNAGDHPLPMTFVTTADIKEGRWTVNPEVAWAVTGKPATLMTLNRQLLHYVQELENQGKYTLTIWPYHAMLGSPNHALVSAIEEVAHFCGAARGFQPNFEIKGGNPLTENYSVLRPEVLTGPGGNAIAQKNTGFIEKLLNYDALFIGGQAKSHCVAWTIDDLLTEINAKDPDLAKKVWLLEDCTSAVGS